MKLTLLCCGLLLLSISCVLGEKKAEGGLTAISTDSTPVTERYEDQEETEQSLLDQVAESEVDDEISSTSERKRQGWKSGRLNKRPKNRFNQLNHQKGKRPNGRKRRPQNNKKGASKSKNRLTVAPIRYVKRSVHTDQLNNAVDDMLEFFSRSLTKENTTITIRLNYFNNKNIKTTPWTFVAIEKVGQSQHQVFKEQSKLRKARAANEPEEETTEVDVAYGYGDESRFDDYSNLQESPNNADQTVETSAENSMATEPNIHAGEPSIIKEDITITEDDEEEDDDEGDAITELAANGSQSFDNNLRLYRTQTPPLFVLPDGSVEYNLQLLSTEEVQEKNFEPNKELFASELLMENGRQARKKESKHDRNWQRRYSRRPTANVDGIEKIQRIGDALIGARENSSKHYVEVQLKIGPIQFTVDHRTGSALQQSRVSSPTLFARLRLTESDGLITALRLKPTKIRPYETFVTFRLGKEDKLPSQIETSRLVLFLSQEMTTAWNSGYLLRRLKRHLKQQAQKNQKTGDKNVSAVTYVGDTQTLVNILTNSSSFEEALSTAIPIVD